jgi:DNA mismatch repair ATPase MutS
LIGLSLALSISEHLLQTKAFSLFVTHFSQIIKLNEIYPNVKNIHFKTTIQYQQPSSSSSSNAFNSNNDESDSKVSLSYLHQVVSGPCDFHTGYGILMSELYGFPSLVIEDAKQLRKVILQSYSLQINVKKNSEGAGEGEK